MNRQQYTRLKEFEKHLNTALNCDYARNMQSNALGIMAEVFKEVFNKDSKLGNGCGRCQIHDLKLLAKEYFKYKNKLEENLSKAREAKNKEEITETNIEENGTEQS